MNPPLLSLQQPSLASKFRDAQLFLFEPYGPFSGINSESRLMTISEQKACLMPSELFLDLELPFQIFTSAG
jgi:hypothetical protein